MSFGARSSAFQPQAIIPLLEVCKKKSWRIVGLAVTDIEILGEGDLNLLPSLGFHRSLSLVLGSYFFTVAILHCSLPNASFEVHVFRISCLYSSLIQSLYIHCINSLLAASSASLFPIPLLTWFSMTLAFPDKKRQGSIASWVVLYPHFLLLIYLSECESISRYSSPLLS